MDFLKLIRSFQELLFEVLTWLIYYPRTLWLVLRHPLQMIDYSNHEQKDDEAEQYTDTLAPPLLLLLTILLLHALEVGLGTAREIETGNETVRTFLNSDQNIVLLRSFLFGLLPLFGALNYVRKRKLPLERANLKPPFYGQCYVTAVFALWVSLATWLGGRAWIAGIVAGVAGLAWYLAVQTLQNRRALDIGLVAAFGRALWVFVEALAYLLVVSLLLAGGIG